MRRLIFILFISASLIQCDSDDDLDCSTVLCAAPVLTFELIDTDTNVSILANIPNGGTLDGLVITNNEDNNELVVNQDYFIGQERIFLNFYLEDIQVSLEGIFDIQISSQLETIPNGCCPTYNYNNVAVTNATFETTDPEGLFLRIFI
ncbi:hypothetical protein [Dokdonia sp.]|uniref:hypothetical protein n=1 Tax=Dokdonia sp. TaxID=2024995 RepID=UPI00326310C8